MRPEEVIYNEKAIAIGAKLHLSSKWNCSANSQSKTKTILNTTIILCCCYQRSKTINIIIVRDRDGH